MGAAKKLVDKEVLRSLVPLNALSDTHFNELIRKAKIEDLSSGYYLFKKGDRDSKAIYVLSGEVALLQGRKVQSVVTATSDEALHPIAPQQPRQFSARTKGRTTIMSIDAGLLDVMLTWDQSSGSCYEVNDIHSEEDEDWMTRMLQSELLVKLPALNIQQLIMRMEEIEAKSGEVIVEQDEEGDYYYIIKQGACVVARKLSERGKPVKLAELNEGASFGEEALLSEGKRNASIIMKTDGILMRLSKQDFDEILKDPLIKQVNYKQGKKVVDKEGAWLDVRLPGEYNNGHIPGSINIPLAAIRDETEHLDSNKKHVVYCDTGRRSASAIFLLGHCGIDGCILTDGLASVPHEDLEITKNSSVASADVIQFDQSKSSQSPGAIEKEHVKSGLELEKLQQTNQIQQERMNALEHDLHLKEEKISVLRIELDQNTQLQEEAKGLQTELEKAIGKSAELEEQLIDSMSSGATFEEEMANLTSRLNKETQDHQVTLDKLVDTDKQTLQYQQAAGDLQQQIRKIQDEKAGLQARLQEEDSIRKALEQRLEAEQKGREKLEQDKQLLGTGLDKELTELRSRLEDQEEARQQAEQQITLLEENFTQKVGELEEAEAELANVKSQLEAVSEIQKTLDIEISSRKEVEQKAEDLNNEFSELQASLAEHEKSRQQAEQRLEEIEQKYSKTRELLDDAQREMEHLKSGQVELSGIQEDIEVERNKRIEFEEQLASLEKEFSQKSEELESTEAEFASLQSQLERTTEIQQNMDIEIDARKKAEQQLIGIEQESVDVKKTLAESREEITALEYMLAELSGVQENLVTEREERELLEQKLENLDQDTVKAQKDLELANSEIDRLKSIQDEMLDMQKTLDAEAEIRKQVEHQLDSLREEHEKSQGALGEAIEELGVSSDELAKENKALQDQVEKISNKADEDRQHYQDERDSWQSMEREFDSLKNDEEVLTQQLEEVTLNKDSLKQELSYLGKDLHRSIESEKEVRNGLEDEIKCLQKELDNMNNKEEENKSKEAELEEELAKLSADLEQADTYASDLDKKLNEAQDRQVASKKEIDNLKSDLGQPRDVIDEAMALRNEMEELKRSMMEDKEQGLAGTGSGSSDKIKTVDDTFDSNLKEENETLRKELENIYREQEIAIETGRAPKPPKPLDIPNLFGDDLLADDNDVDDSSTSLPTQTKTVKPVKEDGSHRDPFAVADLDKKAFQSVEEGAKGSKRWMIFTVLAVVLVLVLGGMYYFLLKPGIDEGPGKVASKENGIDDISKSSDTSTQVAGQTTGGKPAKKEAATITLPKKTVTDKRSTRTAVKPERRKIPRKVVPRITGTKTEKKTVAPGKSGYMSNNTGDAVSDKPKIEKLDTSVKPVVSLMSAGRAYSDVLKMGGRGPVMVKALGGEFEMGSASSSTYFDERPKHTVKLKAFSISKYEVTFNEYDQYAEAKGLPKPDDNGWGRGRRPVINVSWDDANAYARWLSEQTGYQYRLPSEAEWEYTARAGSSTLYWWGSLFSEDKANCFNCGGQWAGEGTAPVGSFKVNPLGLHDMSGNVMEWTQDCFHKNYKGAPVDGSAWKSADCVSRMLRGGSYRTTTVNLRTSKRDHLPPGISADNIGFRLVRTNTPYRDAK